MPCIRVVYATHFRFPSDAGDIFYCNDIEYVGHYYVVVLCPILVNKQQYICVDRRRYLEQPKRTFLALFVSRSRSHAICYFPFFFVLFCFGFYNLYVLFHFHSWAARWAEVKLILSCRYVTFRCGMRTKTFSNDSYTHIVQANVWSMGRGRALLV